MQRMLSTREFAQAIGISESSARRMADSGVVQIHRTRGGHRRIPVAEAIRYVRENRTNLTRPDLLGLSIDPGEIVKETYNDLLIDALHHGHAKQVTGLLQAMYASGTSIAEICDGPIQFAMNAIGEKWPHDKRAIFLEHRATLLCVRGLHQLRMSIPDPDEHGPEALGGAPSGDRYLLPSLMVALTLHECGFNETSLGPDTPLDILADAIEDERPALTWLSISTPVHSRTQVREIQQLAKIAAEHGSALLIGGRYSKEIDFEEGTGVIRCETIGDLRRHAIRMIDQWHPT